jgi:predicted RNA-binding protein with RPS1 domain
MWGNTIAIHNVFFQEKNYKVKLLTIIIRKKLKFTKKILEKNKEKRRKNHMEKHYSNQQCFKEKTTMLNSQLAQY